MLLVEKAMGGLTGILRNIIEVIERDSGIDKDSVWNFKPAKTESERSADMIHSGFSSLIFLWMKDFSSTSDFGSTL